MFRHTHDNGPAFAAIAFWGVASGDCFIDLNRAAKHSAAVDLGHARRGLLGNAQLALEFLGGDPVSRRGEQVTEVVPDRKGSTLTEHISDHVVHGSEVHTDVPLGYNAVSTMYDHKTVNHGRSEYVGPDDETTNSIEGFFSQLKRTIAGTHISVSDKHLWKYAKECEFRFSRRLTPERMLSELLSRFPELDA